MPTETPVLISYEKLTFDYRFYPRQSVDTRHVTALTDAIQAGADVPPILLAQDYRVIDGWHRARSWHHLGREIPAIIREYESEAAMFAAAVMANRAHGLAFDSHDRRRIVELGMKEFGLQEGELVDLLHVPVEKIKTLMLSWGRGPAGERVALKYPVKHLGGSDLTPPQIEEIQGPLQGTSYGYLARRLVRGLELDLLPPERDDPGLWEELRKLHSLLNERLR